MIFFNKNYIPVVAILLLLIMTIPLSFDFPVSVVPGWHTNVYSPYIIWSLLLIIVLLLTTIGYWIFKKRGDKINWTLFAIHFILTLSIIMYLKFPSIYLNMQQTSQDNFLKAIPVRIKIIPIAKALFIAGQAVFIIYFGRAINSKKVAA